MNKLFLVFTPVFIFYLIYGFYLSQFELKLIGKKLNSNPLQSSYRMQQNIYTDLTIGSGKISDIIDEAKKASTQYIMLTDLNPTSTLENDYYAFNIGVLFGAKVTNSDYSLTLYSAQNKSYIQQFNFGYNEKNSAETLIINNYELDKKFYPAADGFDVINLKNMANRVWSKKKVSTLWSLIFYPFNPKIALIRLYRDPEEELKIFDDLSKIKKTNMYLSTEATAKALPLANVLLKFPSYNNTFKIASQRILLKSDLKYKMESDQEKILSALKSGSFYISIDAFGDSTGFETFLFDNKTNKYYFMNDNVRLDKSIELHYKLPFEPNCFYEVVLFKNGERIDYRSVSEGHFKILKKGNYRLQVRLNTDLPFPDNNKWLTWIFSNNFYIK